MNAVGAEILTQDGTQWWQNSNNPTYVFPCTPGQWHRVTLTQFHHSASNKWIKTLTINEEDRYRITSDHPSEGTLTAFDNIPGRQFSKNKMRNFKIEAYEPVCTDPCLGKQNCVTIADCNEIFPEKGKIAGIISNPSRHYKFSFDLKCTSEKDPQLAVRSANALMLNSIGADDHLWDFDTTFFEIVTLRDNPMNVLFAGNRYKREVVGEPGRDAYAICPTTEWDSYVFEQKALDSTTTATSLTRESDGVVIFSHTDLTNDLPQMPDTIYVMAGSNSYQPSRLFPVRNIAFENL